MAQVKLGDGQYTVNPKYDRRRIRRTMLGLGKQEHIYRYFVEGFPAQMPFFTDFIDARKKDLTQHLNYTAQQIAMASEKKLISEFLRPALDFMTLLLAVGAGLGLGAIIMAVIQGVK